MDELVKIVKPFFSLFRQMTQNNVGALVVLKPGEQKSIAGIITERGIWEITFM